MKAAAIDIGSNSILLTIAEPESPRPIPLKICFDEANVTGLSKGLAAGDKITEAAQERAFKVLRHYREVLDQHRPEKFRVVGTEAFRRASNGEVVRQRISEILGKEVDIISGQEEAELSFWSVQKEHPDRTTKKIVFDIGGASSELCLGSSQGIEERVSLKVGSVTLTEKFNLQEASSPEAATSFVKSLIDEAQWPRKISRSIGIGVAGTMTSLMAIDLGLLHYNRDKVHGFSIPAADVRRYRDKMLSLSLKDRQNIVGLEANRADVFGGGLIIASSICDYFGWSHVTCMDAGIRFGVLYDLLGL